MSSKLVKGQAKKRSVRKSTTSERSVSKAIESYLSARRIYNDRLNSGLVMVTKGDGRPYPVRLCKAGTPDRFFIYRGRIVFVEVKREGEEPSEVQLDRQKELKAAGAVVLNVDSIDSFISEFSQLQKRIEQ